jgi:hypothetical protein
MLHVLFGVLGILFAVALFTDTLNASETNIPRIKTLSLCVMLFIVLSYVVGGYWYVTLYGPDKIIIKAGPWPWAHNYFMEVKEHLFFVVLLLSLYLPVVVYKGGPDKDRDVRNLTLGISGFIVLLGLAMEGAGAIISKGVTIGLLGR